MARSKPPEIISMTAVELEQLIAQLRSLLPPELFLKLEAILRSLQWLMGVIEQKTLSLRRLRRIIFGSKSEKTSTLFSKGGAGRGSKPKGPKGKKNRQGHGRKAATEYSGAQVVSVPHHEGLCAGHLCPKCLKGKLRQLSPARLIRIIAQPMISATLFELVRLRCVLCGAVFTARAPAEAAQGKYDSSVGVMLAISRYGMGVPMYRTEKWQNFVEVPMPASTQWELINEAAKAPEAVYDALEIHAAQAEQVYTDDTKMWVQEVAKQRAEADSAEADKKQRTGSFTTGIVVKAGHNKIALFMTGANHAGENLDRLLKHRAAELQQPVHMSDGLLRNESKQYDTILCNCMVHARRNFVDITEGFPEECRHVIEQLRQIYAFDAQCKIDQASDQERLRFHQQHSGPVMEALKKWMEEQFEQKKVEPNSGLGQAIRYMLKRWDRLTRFLHVPGAPLDNNIAEAALKAAILHRKNSLSFKTLRGAKVGDAFMSLIHTCALNRINPFEYLMALNRNAEAVLQAPTEWFPWNYRQALPARKPPDAS